MRFPLRRYHQDRNCTLGVIEVGDLLLYTIERPWVNNQPFVSCIPSGRYALGLWKPDLADEEEPWRMRLNMFSKEYGNERSAIQIEIGNYANDFAGCVGVGYGTRRYFTEDSQLRYMVTESGLAWNTLLAIVEDNANKKVGMWVEISDPASSRGDV